MLIHFKYMIRECADKTSVILKVGQDMRNMKIAYANSTIVQEENNDTYRLSQNDTIPYRITRRKFEL